MTQVKHHQPCEDCGSSDGMSIYEDHSFCHVCRQRHWLDETSAAPKASEAPYSPPPTMPPVDVTQAIFRAIHDRGLTKETCIRFEVKSSPTTHYYPWHDEEGHVVGHKIRTVKTKSFSVSGEAKDAVLFGQNHCKGSGKYITICEGELDAMSVDQMFAGKYDVVSVRNGASSAKKELQKQLEFLESYDNIVLCFDQDKAGKAAVEECQDLFEPGKLLIIDSLNGFKDPNEMLMDNRSAEFMDCFWKAKEYSPAGLMTGEDAWEDILQMQREETTPYPWSGLNRKLRGFFRPQLVTITSGSGMGKTEIMRAIQYHILETTDFRMGLIPLEERAGRSALGLMGLHAGRVFHSDEDVPEEELRPHWDATLGTGRVTIFSAFGHSNIDSIVSKVRFMAKAHDCQVIFLDHLSINVSSQEQSDERKAIDAIMTRLAKLCRECNITIFLVSHLSRVSSNHGKAHEEGGRVTLGQLRGSQAIAQLSDVVIGAERNQQHEDPVIRNITCLRILKNRHTGETGPSCWLKYDGITGRMSEVPKPVENDRGDF